MPLDYWLIVLGEKFGKFPHEIREQMDVRDLHTAIHMLNAIAMAENPNRETERIM